MPKSFLIKCGKKMLTTHADPKDQRRMPDVTLQDVYRSAFTFVNPSQKTSVAAKEPGSTTNMPCSLVIKKEEATRITTVGGDYTAFRPWIDNDSKSQS
ncbi:Hypothetical predicted protein [Octopus vulgaris]|uniref:Uncharacterized protein n=1 Tax=Octopus vulgaris TaxID=6645 RepID=A0AA36ANM0_OCTVU|nr:Hypothetical predicted protein [Octopus vulgaris]